MHTLWLRNLIVLLACFSSALNNMHVQVRGPLLLCFLCIKIAGDLNDSSFLSFRRSGASDFIVPYWRFSKSLNHPFSVGMRFKISNDSDDANDRSVLLTPLKMLVVQQSFELLFVFQVYWIDFRYK